MDVAGYEVFDVSPEVQAWSKAALLLAHRVLADPSTRAAQMRHGDTWFVGVDALPNGPDGAIDSVPLAGPWRRFIVPPETWHPAQLSVIYPGYPRQDTDESDANHRYRVRRCAAHVDGLLPEGPARRRFLREPHAFVLGLPLNSVEAAPLMVWPGSHRTMGAAFRARIGDADPVDVDLTEIYQATRIQCFEAGPPVAVGMQPGQAVLMHRHLLHGVAPWGDAQAEPNGRMVAYFRPQFRAADWLLAN